MIETRSARVAIAVATANGWQSPDLTVRVQTSRTGKSGSAVLHGMDCGKILAQIDKLRGVVRAWTVWAYAADGWSEGGEQDVVFRSLLDEYYRQRTVRQHGKIALLAVAAMDDYRRRAWSSKPGMGASAYARLVGFRRTDWSRWREARDVMMDVIREWDLDGLAPVGEVLPRSVHDRVSVMRPEDLPLLSEALRPQCEQAA